MAIASTRHGRGFDLRGDSAVWPKPFVPPPNRRCSDMTIAKYAVFLPRQDNVWIRHTHGVQSWTLNNNEQGAELPISGAGLCGMLQVGRQSWFGISIGRRHGGWSWGGPGEGSECRRIVIALASMTSYDGQPLARSATGAQEHSAKYLSSTTQDGKFLMCSLCCQYGKDGRSAKISENLDAWRKSMSTGRPTKPCGPTAIATQRVAWCETPNSCSLSRDNLQGCTAEGGRHDRSCGAARVNMIVYRQSGPINHDRPTRAHSASPVDCVAPHAERHLALCLRPASTIGSRVSDPRRARFV